MLARCLEALDEVGGACEQHAVAVLDEGVAEGCRDVRLAEAGRGDMSWLFAVFVLEKDWLSPK